MGRKRRLAEVSGVDLSHTVRGVSPIRTLDLHGCRADQADARVRDFIMTCSRTMSGQVVRIVTGWGKGSAEAPVLLPVVRRLLETSLAAYITDHTMDGGSYLIRVK